MKSFLKTFSCLFLAAFSRNAFGWGKVGHDAVAAIAEQNLDPQVKETILSYTGGRSIIYFASWPDQIRFIDEYQTGIEYKGKVYPIYKKFAHTASYDENGKAVMDESKGPDAIVQISELIDSFRDGKYRELPDSIVLEAIKYLSHAVGDMHCPGHIRKPGYSGSKSVNFFGQKITYHALWDEYLLETWHNWSYLEYLHEFNNLSPEEASRITSGSVVDWGEDAAGRVQKIWDWFVPGGYYTKPMTYVGGPLVDEMIQLAGYRLAKVFNTMFGPAGADYPTPSMLSVQSAPAPREFLDVVYSKGAEAEADIICGEGKIDFSKSGFKALKSGKLDSYAVWSILKRKSDSREFVVLSVSLDSSSKEARKAQAESIYAWIEKNAAGVPVVLVGDLAGKNPGPLSGDAFAPALILQPFLKNARNAALSVDPAQGTCNVLYSKALFGVSFDTLKDGSSIKSRLYFK